MPGTARAPNTARWSLQQRLERVTLQRFQCRDHIFNEGDPIVNVFQVEDGVVAIYKLLSDGRRQIMDFACQGDFVDLDTAGEHKFSAEATCSVKVRCFNAATVDEAARHDPEFAHQLLKATSAKLAASRQLLIAIGQRTAIERIALFLKLLCRQTESEKNTANIVRLPMRRADIGDFLGLKIETVSRTFTQLRNMGVIDIYHYTEIRIVDMAKLTSLSESSPVQSHQSRPGLRAAAHSDHPYDARHPA